MAKRQIAQRRTVAIAVGCVVTAFAATVGLGANFGLFGLAQPHSQVGTLDRPPRPAAVATPRAVSPGSTAPASTTTSTQTATTTPDAGRMADD